MWAQSVQDGLGGGPQPIQFENDELFVDVLPSNGGKIASIRCKKDNTEFLLSGSRYNHIASFEASAPFTASDCAGVDECLPSLAASGSDTPGGTIPDHGDFWRLPWDVITRQGNSVTLQARGLSRPLIFTRHISLSGNTLAIRSKIKNIGGSPFPIHYACHPLLAVDPEDRIVLPRGVESMNVYESENRLPSGPVTWPIHFLGDERVDLGCVGKPLDGIADMLFSNRLSSGVCGIYRRQYGKGIVMDFNVEMLPYLGLWMSFGGWPKSGTRKQYAVALEPTTAPCGSLVEALSVAAAPILEKDKPLEFWINFSVLGTKEWVGEGSFVEHLRADG